MSSRAPGPDSEERKWHPIMLASALYAEVYLICLIVVCLLLVWNRRSVSRSSSEQWLTRLFITFILSFSGNFLFTLFNSGLVPIPFKRQVSYVMKSVFYIGLIMGVCSWCGFAETEMQRDTRGYRKRNYYFLLIVTLSVAVIIANPWTRNVFLMDENDVYHRQPMYNWLMIFLMAFTSIYSVRLLVTAGREFDPSRKSHLYLAASFPLSLLAAWLLSFISESMPVVCVSIMLELLCLFVGTNQQQISMDKLTQVNNRQNLIGFINYKLYDHVGRLYLLMIDVDYFKTINDTYGHLEGDNALIIVSSSLKRACNMFKKRPFIARYGGDEFIVVLEGTQEEANALCDSIRATLQEFKESKNLPYNLSLSIGVCSYRSGMTAKEMIAAADEEMYRVKQDRDQKRHG